MDRTMANTRLTQLFIYCFLLIQTGIQSTKAAKCSTGCTSSSSLFTYQVGHTYEYALDSTISVLLAGSDTQETSLKIHGTVLLSQLPNCDQLLRLQNVVIQSPDNKKHPGIEDITKPVRFNFNDGKVDTQICSEPGDNQNSLNIKRAIISLFQASRGHTETDVFGVCPTHTSTSKNGPEFILTKTRNLNDCAHRESIQQGFLSTTFNDNSAIKSTPLLSGDYSSEQRFKDGVLEKVHVTENYHYRPFSPGRGGAKSHVVTRLTFQKKSADAPGSQVSKPRTIIFENPHLVPIGTNSDNIIRVLKKTVTHIESHVDSASARDFTDLIRVLRVSNKADMLNVYGQVNSGAGFRDKETAKKVFLDALFRTGTGDSVEVVVELIMHKRLSEKEQKLAYLSFANAKHVTAPSLNAVADLLEKSAPREALLGIGILAGHYCREHSCSGNELQKLSDSFAKKLGNCSPRSRHEEDTVLAALKGLRNMHRLASTAVDKVSHCIKSDNTPVRIRVAALETVQGAACEKKLTREALTILQNRDLDSELRIEAYLALVQCPTAQFANDLKNLLDTETVNQVGSFIYTHLNNLRASTNPHRELARQHLGMVFSTKKFPIDFRRYSTNSEFSYSMDSLGLGASIENNIIYSQKSFLPRSASLNLTGELFGHSFNLLELSARQENLDLVIEHYFGPKGVFSGSSPQEVFEQAKSTVEELQNEYKNRLDSAGRGKRATRQEVDAFQHKNTEKFNTKLDLDLDIKMFGSELFFLSLGDKASHFSPKALINEFFDHLEKGIDSIRNFKHNCHGNVMFLDVEVAYPTSVGIPLKVTVTGTGTMKLETSGQIDVKRIIKDPKNANFKLVLIPSANIEVIGALTVDAQVVSTGLEVVGNLHSSTGTDIHINLLNGNGVDVTVGLPVEKQEIFSVSHKILFSTQERGHPAHLTPLKFNVNKKAYHGCFDQLSPYIGLTFCGDADISLAVPAEGGLAFPFNGPSTLSLRIEKEDLQKYHFRLLKNFDDPNHRTLEVLFDTPNSKTKRTISFNVDAMMEPNKVLKVTLHSPIRNVAMEAKLIDEEKEVSASVTLRNGDEEYFAKVGAETSGPANRKAYKPLVEFRAPQAGGDSKYQVDGQIIVEKGDDWAKYTFQGIQVSVPGQSAPLRVDGFVGHKGKQTVDGDLKISHENNFVSAKGKLELFEGITGKITDLEVHNSFNPNFDFRLNYEFTKKQEEYKQHLLFVHGTDLNTRENRLEMIEEAKLKGLGTEDFDIYVKGSLTYPVTKTNAKLEGALNMKKAEYKLEATDDKTKIYSHLKALVNNKNKGDFDVDFKGQLNEHFLAVKTKRNVVDDVRSTYTLNVDTSNGGKLDINGKVAFNSPREYDTQFKGILKIPGKSNTYDADAGSQFNDRKAKSYVKLSADNAAVVDFDVDVDRTPDPKGTFRFNVKDLLNAKSEFTTKQGQGSGNALVELLTLNRKLKGDATFHIANPVYNFDGNLFYDADKDNSKKVHLATKNEVNKGIKSSNVLELGQYETKLNFNGESSGELFSGTIKGEYDLTLPNGYYFDGKLFRDVKHDGKTANGEAELNLSFAEKKGAVPYAYKGKCKIGIDDLTKYLFDWEQFIEITGNNKKYLEYKGAFKHAAAGHNGFKFNGDIFLDGVFVVNPWEYKTSAEYAPDKLKYNVQCRHGDSCRISVQGDLAKTQEGATNKFFMQGDFSNEKFKHFKLEHDSSVKRPRGDHDDYEFKVSNSATLNDKTVKGSGLLKGNINKGLAKVTVELPNEAPFSVNANYEHNDRQDAKQCKVGLDVLYAQNKEVKLNAIVNFVPGTDLDVQLTLNTPAEYARNVDVTLKHKKQGEKLTHTEMGLKSDDKKYEAVVDLDLTETAPVLDIKFVYPDNKKSRFLAKFERFGERKGKGELKIEQVYDFNLDATANADCEDFEKCLIRAHIDSNKLDLNDVHLTIESKKGGSGNIVEVSAKSGDKNIVSGTTTFQKKQEQGKYIVEGSGTITVKETPHSANFKYMYNNVREDNEKGVQMVLNAGYGQKNVVVDLKLTNKQFRMANSYCEPKQECAHIDLNSIVKNEDINVLDHELEVSIDLRKLGLSHEFGLKATTHLRDLVLDHTVDMHFHSQDKAKYQYSVFVHPKNAGITLTLPQRVIALEGNLDIPRPNTIGPVKAELSLSLNKEKDPNQKTSIALSVNPTYSNQKASVQADLKFTHPGVKSMLVSGRANFDAASRNGDFYVKLDVFATTAHSLELHGKLNSLNLGDRGVNMTSELNVYNKERSLDFVVNEHFAITDEEFGVGSMIQCRHDPTKSAGFLVSANLRHVELLVRSPYGDLLHVNSKLDLNEKYQKVDSEVTTLGVPPMKYTMEAKDFNSLKYTAGRRDSPQKYLQFESSLILGKAGEVRAEIIEGGSRKDLFHSSVLLDDANFLKTDFGVNTDNIKAHLENIRSEAKHASENLKNTMKTAFDDIQARIHKLTESANKFVPDFKPLVADYQKQLNQIKEELLADKSIKEFTDFLNKVFGAAFQAIADIMKNVGQRLEKLSIMIKELYEKTADLLNNQIIPQLREAYLKISTALTDLMQTVLGHATEYLVKFTEWVKSHQEDINKIAETIADSLKGFGKVVSRALLQFKHELEDFIKVAYEQVKSIPVLTILKEKYEEMVVGVTVPEQVYKVLSEIVSTVKDVLPTPELREVLQQTYNYLEQKLKQEPVDDIKELKSIYELLLKAVKSLLKLVQDNMIAEPQVPGFMGLPSPVSFGGLHKQPDFTTLRLSPLNFLRYNKIPTWEDVQAMIKPLTMNPLSLLPPFPMRGYVADGQHFFTFDRRHLTFPGSCSYVLAQDFVDKNFTLVANLQNGAMKSITLADKHDVIEISDQGAVTLNGAAADLPTHKNDIHAWRKFHTVNLLTKYGVYVRCNNDLSLCSFEVNGFYLGKLHGMLGNGNSEPYDDFKLPSGAITTKESEFGNAYKMTDSCPDVSAPAHHDHEHHHGSGGPTCDYFSGATRMRSCFPFVDPAPFRQACQHAASSAKNPKQAACSIAQIYTAACRNEWIPISAPKECGKCDKNINVGDLFSAKVPGKQADIIFVIETEPANAALIKELFHPLLNQLLGDLKSRGITDTHVAVIGFNEKQKYPALFTSGGKINFRGKPGSVKAINDEPAVKPLKTGHEKFDELIETISKLVNDVKYEFGLTSAYAAYDDAVEYPFRAGATKTIIGIHGTNVKAAKLPFQNIKFYLASKVAEYKGITYNLIAPLELHTTGLDEKTIVGFSTDTVFTLNDSKKKTPGSVELRSKVHHTAEPSVDLALNGYGIVYSVQNFNHAKAQKQNKNYISVISNSLVDQISRTEMHSDCICGLEEGLYPVPYCTVKERKILPAAKVQKAARG